MTHLNFFETELALELPDTINHQVRYLFTDVDDTLTWQGKLPSNTLRALEQLAEAGIQVIPVTGACAGWCDCMVRTWPVSAVIGENGAFWMQKNALGQIKTHYFLDDIRRRQQHEELLLIQDQLLNEFPFARATADQRYRETDIAFDIHQQHHNSDEEIAILIKALEAHGIHARKSSIHINAWRGDYDKASTAIAWLKSQGVSEQEFMLQVAFVGDSANDISMFDQFKMTFGVANIRAFLDLLNTPPRFITKKNGGFGFVEVANCLLKHSI
ncbi:hypothetical protein DN062_13620 [Nitrincola tibetensis]|uniref:HAD-IIB family hydrolase n=1 Tax=Nitrincola tibetensis TaxID=2219697 RepID=A0A364NJG4_9GAMM|nr:HAD-IIB family hydrolase [Nitrincola tibetensis]RAU17206.1 hypothetical protein DN062_13620 [Nitrincola tibetensis]